MSSATDEMTEALNIEMFHLAVALFWKNSEVVVI